MSFKKTGFFWPSYGDLMTSLFFIMLILYILTYAKMKLEQQKYISDAQKFRKIEKIEKAIAKLDTNYFSYDSKSKRFRLRVDVRFDKHEHIIPDRYSKELKKAGKRLFNLISKLKEKEQINYLLIIEGTAQRSKLDNGKWNHKEIPNVGYKLSYKRALALYNFWKKKNYDFREFNHCEVLIVGSGYFGKSRKPVKNLQKGGGPGANRRFTIQITPKVGQLTDLK